MKKRVEISFENTMINDNSNESHQINTFGILDIKDDYKIIKFKDEKQQLSMEISYKDRHAILKKIDFNVISMLEFIPGKNITNNYKTPYGGIMLISKVLSYNYDSYGITLLYCLINGNDIVGNYKLRLQFKERDDEY